MMFWSFGALFLYFPEDKTEYIPAVISMVIFLIAAILTMRWIMKISKKQEDKWKQFEEERVHKKS